MGKEVHCAATDSCVQSSAEGSGGGRACVSVCDVCVASPDPEELYCQPEERETESTRSKSGEDRMNDEWNFELSLCFVALD